MAEKNGAGQATRPPTVMEMLRVGHPPRLWGNRYLLIKFDRPRSTLGN